MKMKLLLSPWAFFLLHRFAVFSVEASDTHRGSFAVFSDTQRSVELHELGKSSSSSSSASSAPSPLHVASARGTQPPARKRSLSVLDPASRSPPLGLPANGLYRGPAFRCARPPPSKKARHEKVPPAPLFVDEESDCDDEDGDGDGPLASRRKKREREESGGKPSSGPGARNTRSRLILREDQASSASEHQSQGQLLERQRDLVAFSQEVVNTYNRTKGVESFLIPVADKVAELTAAARPYLARLREWGKIADEAVQLDFGEDARQGNPGLDGWVKKNASAMQELQQALEKLTFSSRSKSSLQRSLEAFVAKSRATRHRSGFGDAVANGVLARIGGERGRDAFVRGFSQPGMERELLAKMTGEEAADALGPLSLKEQEGAAADVGERPSKRQRRGRPLVMGVEVSLLPDEYLERELAEEEKVEARGVQEYPQGQLRMEEERRKKLREIMAVGGVVQDFRVQWPLVPGSRDFLCRLRFFKLLPEAKTKDPVRLHRLDIVGPESEGRKKLLSIEIVPQGAWPWAD